MAKIIKVVRNNWKKSAFGACAVVYGINYGYEKYKIDQLMQTYCEEAVQYGEIPVPHNLKPRNITVILNPAANKRKAKANFEKYCAPLLHLAGFTVDVIQTESEGQARTLAGELKNTDVIVVAGGDGTLSETVTGLMRAHGSVKYPLGVLPLGRTNSVSCSLLGRDREGAVSPGEMAAAAMAIVRGETKQIDVIKVEVIEKLVSVTDNEDREESTAQQEEKQVDHTPRKPIYSLSGIRWGTFRDALNKQDKYWYLGSLRGYVAVLFASTQNEPVTAHVMFTHACNGCNRCYNERTDLHPSRPSRWYHYVIPSFTKKAPETPQINYREVVNNRCGVTSEMELSGLEINVECPCVCRGSRGVSVSSGPEELAWLDYVVEGWRRVKGEPPSTKQQLEAQTLEIVPSPSMDLTDKWFSIDNEDYEVKPVRVTLVPNAVQVFYPKQDHTSYTLLEKALLGCC